MCRKTDSVMCVGEREAVTIGCEAAYRRLGGRFCAKAQARRLGTSKSLPGIGPAPDRGNATQALGGRRFASAFHGGCCAKAAELVGRGVLRRDVDVAARLPGRDRRRDRVGARSGPRPRALAALSARWSGAREPELVAVEFEQVAAGGDQSPFQYRQLPARDHRGRHPGTVCRPRAVHGITDGRSSIYRAQAIDDS
jgi:hypothetical protein